MLFSFTGCKLYVKSLNDNIILFLPHIQLSVVLSMSSYSYIGFPFLSVCPQFQEAFAEGKTFEVSQVH